MDSWALRILGYIALTAALSASYAQIDSAIRIWKVGSPHKGNTPRAEIPTKLREEWSGHGFRVDVEGFPAAGFAARFFQSVTRNAAPDVLVFDNFGVMDGITTQLGKFEGIGEEPIIRRDLIRVTGAFDALLGPEKEARR
jgi:hypothetical protein